MQNPIKQVKTVPQPLKTVMVLWFVVFIGVFIAAFTVNGVREELLFLPFALVAFALGLVLALNINGCATAMAEMNAKGFGAKVIKPERAVGHARFTGCGFMAIAIFWVFITL
jgi:hypothetical protein